jgi:hypothetical protein
MTTPVEPQDLTPGTIFDTPFEQGYEVITTPTTHVGLDSNFQAYDSDRVVCSFSVVMVTSICVPA